MFWFLSNFFLNRIILSENVFIVCRGLVVICGIVFVKELFLFVCSVLRRQERFPKFRKTVLFRRSDVTVSVNETLSVVPTDGKVIQVIVGDSALLTQETLLITRQVH